MDSPPVPPDVSVARAIRALRDTTLGCGAACLGLAVVATAILALGGADPRLSGPAVTILGGGQLLAIAGAVVGALGLRAVLADRPPRPVLAATAHRLHWVFRAVLVWSAASAVAWTAADPSGAVLAIALAAVTAQLAAVVVVLRRRLRRAA